MEPNLSEVAEWVFSLKEWQSAFPWLKETDLRLIRNHLENAALRQVLYTELLSDEIREKYFTPAASPEERTSMVLADLLIALLFPEKIISDVIDKAAAEIEEVYQAILQEGGGWSSKSDPDKRKTAALEWCNRHEARLSYLKKSHLEDSTLYDYGTRQEKRNFFSRLLLTIFKGKTLKKLTSQKIMDLLKRKNLKGLKQPL